jgi:hypothetical protein
MIEKKSNAKQKAQHKNDNRPMQVECVEKQACYQSPNDCTHIIDSEPTI